MYVLYFLFKLMVTIFLYQFAVSCNIDNYNKNHNNYLANANKYFYNRFICRHGVLTEIKNMFVECKLYN